MEQTKIDRINELSRLSRERELTGAEQKEREALRAEYIGEWRKSAEATLQNVVVVEPDGTKHKLAKKE